MKLYKYRSVDKDIFERDIRTFTKNQFFASNFEMLNDPFEANFNDTTSHTLDMVKSMFSVDTSNLRKQLDKVIGYKVKLGVFSLSKTCYSQQMWAYYSTSYSGYCIEYDLEKLKDKTKNFDFSMQLDITYSDDIPTIKLEDFENISIFQKMFGTKTTYWRHEEETRLLFENFSIKEHHESAITGIVFGYKANNNLIETFKDAFDNRDIKFYRVVVNRQKNRLEKDLILELQKQRNFNLTKYTFEVLKYTNNLAVENYHLVLKGPSSNDDAKNLIFAFREKICYKPSNIHVYNTPSIVELIDIYPLRGKDYIHYAEACIASSDFDSENLVIFSPYKDSYYQEEIEKL